MTTANNDSVTNSEADKVEELNDADAEALFAEAAGKLSGETPATADDDTSSTAAAQTDDADAAAATTGAGQTGDKPADQSGGGDDGAAAAAASSGDGDEGALDDPAALKAALEAARKEAREFEQKFRSREGRERALQRELEKARAGQATGEQQPRKPLKELLESDQIKAIAEEYPDFQPLIEAVREAGERVDGVSSEVGQVRTDVVSTVFNAEETRLNQALPNWQELAADDRFQAWVDDQPKKIRDAVADNWDAITNAEAVREVFETFRDTVVSPKTAQVTTEPTTDAGGKRQRQASSAQATKVNGPAAASGESDDPEVLFAQAAAKVDRDRGIR